MERQIPWIRKPSENVKSLIDEANSARLFLLQENGPTSFTIKQEGHRKKYRVTIGNVQRCSCHSSLTLCIHILYVMIKVFRIPPQNPVVWQLSLIDREISEILNGRMVIMQNRNKSVEKKKQMSVTRRPIDDLCVICQEDMNPHRSYIVWCKTSCGNNFHEECMREWAKHRTSIGDSVSCPFCRVEWPLSEVSKLKRRRFRRKTSKSTTPNLNAHSGIDCDGCRQCPIIGTWYRCSICAEYNLCENCYNNPSIHTQHPFCFKSSEDNSWQEAHQSRGLSGIITATNPSGFQLQNNRNSEAYNQSETNRTRSSPHPSSSNGLDSRDSHDEFLESDIQYREITADDYDMLLQLDETIAPKNVVPEHYLHLLNNFQPSESDQNLTNIQCSICFEPVATDNGLLITKLPCDHLFHEDCIAEWLTNHKDSCPICSKPVIFQSDADINAEGTVNEYETNSISDRSTPQSNSSQNRSVDTHRRTTESGPRKISNQVAQNSIVKSSCSQEPITNSLPSIVGSSISREREKLTTPTSRQTASSSSSLSYQSKNNQLSDSDFESKSSNISNTSLAISGLGKKKAFQPNNGNSLTRSKAPKRKGKLFHQNPKTFNRSETSNQSDSSYALQLTGTNINLN
eukprot:gb/GECH01010509.1/.p1 GENE.gb/GECH01010509.1/~~gb/GECH01010509.1/.p1  ORF type:complete len:628 (+),score=78.77 gb/GECH01010509.1/:1-1884(+)